MSMSDPLGDMLTRIRSIMKVLLLLLKFTVFLLRDAEFILALKICREYITAWVFLSFQLRKVS